MSRPWYVLGGLVALGGALATIWTLWWVPPASPPSAGRVDPTSVAPTAAAPASTAPTSTAPPAAAALPEALEARLPSLRACRESWREANPEVEQVLLRLAPRTAEEGLLREVRPELPGSLLMAGCAEAALEGLDLVEPIELGLP